MSESPVASRSTALESARGHLPPHEHKSVLRFIACGSPGDGKRTLLGRLVFESMLLGDDQRRAADDEPGDFGKQSDETQFVSLRQGLDTDRDHSIVTDINYRYFASPRRRFVIADIPGHARYARNMIIGASNAEAAVVLVDARQGVLAKTRLHSYLLSLLGVRHIALAVNKLDLLAYDETRFRKIEIEYRDFAQRIGCTHVECIPVSALNGDNILAPSVNTPWYHGATVLNWLESIDIDEERLQKLPFRLPVQWVNRSDANFHGVTGTIVSGVVSLGDRVRVQPSGRETRVERIIARGRELTRAGAGLSIAMSFIDDIETARGDLIAAVDAAAEVADQFEAVIVWMADQPMLQGRSYVMKIGPKTVNATITPIKYRIHADTLAHLAAETLEANQIGSCELQLDEPIAFDPYMTNRDTGRFILIDPVTDDAIGGGMLKFALRRAHNIRMQPVDVDRKARAALTGQRGFVLWFTGLSGAGKSTIANLVESKLHALRRQTYLLDGDNVRHGLSRDLGFTAADRVENIRRVAEVAKLMLDAGLIVLAAFISPFRAERRMARALFGQGEFIEIFVDTPLAVAEQRDPKGLYRKARIGELKNFTGIDSPYEAPEAAEICVTTATVSADAASDRVLSEIRRMGMLNDR